MWTPGRRPPCRRTPAAAKVFGSEIVWRSKAGVAWGRRQHQSRTKDLPLARKIHVQLIDDISGEDAQENLWFSLDGTDYEIDLAEPNAAGLRTVLAPFIAHGRRVRSVSGSRSARTVPSSREETQKIREWAMAYGYSPNPRTHQPGHQESLRRRPLSGRSGPMVCGSPCCSSSARGAVSRLIRFVPSAS